MTEIDKLRERVTALEQAAKRALDDFKYVNGSDDWHGHAFNYRVQELSELLGLPYEVESVEAEEKDGNTYYSVTVSTATANRPPVVISYEHANRPVVINYVQSEGGQVMDIYVIKVGTVNTNQLDTIGSFDSVGYYATEEEALKVVRANQGDINEAVHTHCVIGRVSEGIYELFEELHWFEWGIPEREAGDLRFLDWAWVPTKRPAILNRIRFLM